MGKTQREKYILLATDALLAHFDSANQSHIKIGRELKMLSDHGLEPVYPYPALLKLFDKTADSKNTELRKRVNAVISKAARSPLIVMPIPLDVALGCLLSDQALDEGWKISLSDTTIVAMASRLNSIIFSYDEKLRQIASRTSAEIAGY